MADPSIGAPTEIYYNGKLRYTNGVEVTVTQQQKAGEEAEETLELSYSLDKDNFVIITATQKPDTVVQINGSNKAMVTVTIKPKATIAVTE